MKTEVPGRAALHNLGCKVNAYETEAMQQLLLEAGYEIVPFSEPADVYIVNTCTVTNAADKKSRQMLHRAKKQNPDAIVAAAGCYVQTAEEKIAKDPSVDLVIGNNRKKDLIRILEEYRLNHRVTDAVADISRTEQEYEELTVSSPAEHTRAFLKVEDGCNQFCSYCIIPYARGRVRSRALCDVINEAENLAANGYQELVLTGIHLSSYGIERGENLLGLIRALHEVDGIARIRLGSLEPGIVTEEFAAALAGLEKVCPHFHLSLQSGSDSVLKRMNRRYTTAEYEEKCRILRRCYEHPAITTDLIVGFPGETDAEFQETLAFAERIRFYEIHVFKYSRREGTKAAAMPDQIPETVKSRRSAALMEKAEQMKQEFIRWYLGKQVEVLFERPVSAEKVQKRGRRPAAARPETGEGETASAAQQEAGAGEAMAVCPEVGEDGTAAARPETGEGETLTAARPEAVTDEIQGPDTLWYEGFTPEYVRVFTPSRQNLENKRMKVEFSEDLY